MITPEIGVNNKNHKGGCFSSNCSLKNIADFQKF